MRLVLYAVANNLHTNFKLMMWKITVESPERHFNSRHFQVLPIRMALFFCSVKYCYYVCITRVLVKLFYSISIFHIKTAIDLYYIQCIVSKQNIYLYFHILYLIWINSHSKRTKIGRIPCEHNVIPNKVEVFWFRSWLLNLKASNRFIESCGISIRIRAFIKRQNGMEWAV